MAEKKKFKETAVGQILLGAAKAINPALGAVLEGVTSPLQAFEKIADSNIPSDKKIELQKIMIEAQQQEEKELTKRHKADAMSDSWLSKNVRPWTLIWCIFIFSMAGILDSIETIPFHINDGWNITFRQIMTSVIGFYFGGRTIEKFKSMK